MASKVCMNVVCGASASIEWRKGWPLRSGELANLCDKCGSAFERMVFCDMFHSKDSGWRECTSCGKRLHCGCIVSTSLFELLDSGGVNCVSCAKNPGLHLITSDEKPNGFGTLAVDNVGDQRPSLVDKQVDGGTVGKMTLMHLGHDLDGTGLNLLQPQNNDTNGICVQMKQEDLFHPFGENGNPSFSNLNQASIGSSQTAKPDICKNMGVKDMYESLAQTNLSITLAVPSGNPNPCPGAVSEEREQSKTPSPFQQGPRSRHLLPKPPKPVLVTGSEPNMGVAPQIRVARPPAEGRGRNQLLPRYWPRITDQELQQISGDPNSTIVPLFEKVLSASDAGRIGRLVLPKACAEAYFPPISQPEGLPLRIQDVKGKEWVFQFRFWPNNNSRMYVLEGVTPCIQSMQLQAGDTVTFSRMDPEGKLIMGFRKAANSVSMQDNQLSAAPNGAHLSETIFPGAIENLAIVSGYSGLLHSLKGSTDPHLNALSKHLSSASGDISWIKNEKHGSRAGEGLLLPSFLVPERRSRNIGSKSKRLVIDIQDALELRLTWEEAQDLLRPPPSVKPSIVTIEDLDFEEYEEPPVFGKKSIFTARSSGEQEQWAQCDSCSKWRRLPVDILLPPKWTCADNTWDQSRCSCSAPDELSSRELENLLRLNKEFKRRRLATSRRPTQEHESSGLEALANAAVLGDNVSDPGATSVAPTTKHPRHRPGCSCIVCIQPPSGKGKHKPTCTCNVCMTVKRRFKTLMMRKKKRQSEREAEIAQRNQHTWGSRDEADIDNASRHVTLQLESSENDARLINELESGAQSNNLSNNVGDSGKAQIDLNCQPDREEELLVGRTRMSMMSLLQVASLPLETYLKQNGLTSLISEQANSGSNVLPQGAGESEGQPQEDCRPISTVQERESGGDEGCPVPDPGE
ncbi:B3 domain-containing transcription repressor VAL2 [Malania oleifera]|uniref:B3 domain-containing transcription repressor VAL2 n=1 Tax=Malania oleifera TaxID=397392 RepID=UPI0025ADCCDE|nr:B3 domain-containing transcription repressor VAL2 [Malania oleifera]XP_057970341.1 B3 domain-containing transcription repressor VAL2 [Malania oleifera]